jgi:hypothetical protein
MGKDRRKRDGNQKQADCSVPSDGGSEPKAQRQPRNRAPQEQRLKGSSKNVDSSVGDKISDPTTPSSQPDSKSGEKSSRTLVAAGSIEAVES